MSHPTPDPVDNGFVSEFGTHAYDVPGGDNEQLEDAVPEEDDAHDPFEPGADAAVDFDIPTFDKRTDEIENIFNAVVAKGGDDQDSGLRLTTEAPTFTFDESVSDDGHDPDSPSDDVLDVMSETNRNTSAIGNLNNRLDEITKSLAAITAHLTQSDKRHQETSASLIKVSTTVDELAKDFNAYQTATANAIAAVERRAHNKQAAANPPVPSAIIPDSVTHRKTNDVIVGAQDRTEPSTTAPVITKKAPILNLSDWA